MYRLLPESPEEKEDKAQNSVGLKKAYKLYWQLKVLSALAVDGI
jgi:hypothetical protein